MLLVRLPEEAVVAADLLTLMAEAAAAGQLLTLTVEVVVDAVTDGPALNMLGRIAETFASTDFFPV